MSQGSLAPSLQHSKDPENRWNFFFKKNFLTGGKKNKLKKGKQNILPAVYLQVYLLGRGEGEELEEHEDTSTHHSSALSFPSPTAMCRPIMKQEPPGTQFCIFLPHPICHSPSENMEVR